MQISEWLRVSTRAVAVVIVIGATSASTAARSESAAARLQVEIGKLSAEESAILKRIQRVHPDFQLSKRVQRYVEVAGGQRRVVYSEMQFESVDGLIFGEFISYAVGFPGSLESVQFSYDAGTALRGFGSFHLTEESVTKTETSCGTSGCILEVMVDGESVHQTH